MAVWSKVPFNPPIVNWIGDIPNAPANSKPMTPLSYFNIFIDDEMFELLTEQTNLYGEQLGKDLNVDVSEIKRFVGILLYTGFVPMPQYRMFWAIETRFPPRGELHVSR